MSIICVCKKGGIVSMAADTLSKFDYTKETAKYVTNRSKIFRAADSMIGIAGHVSAQLHVSMFLDKEEYLLDSPRSILAMALDLHAYLKDQCYWDTSEDDDDDGRFESLGMSMLIANEHGIFGVYNRRSVLEYERFYAFGSGADYGMGAMFATYDTDLSALSIAEIGARAACEFHDGCGEPITSDTIQCRG